MEAQRLSDYDEDVIQEATQEASNIIHHDFGRAKIERLEGDAVGQQNMNQKSVESGMKIDPGFVMQATREEITHVLVHEGLHLQSAQRSGSRRVDDIRYEEAFTELGAARKTNQSPLAYQEEIAYVRRKLRETDANETEMIEAYAQGNVDRINKVIEQAEGSSNELALAA